MFKALMPFHGSYTTKFILHSPGVQDLPFTIYIDIGDEKQQKDTWVASPRDSRIMSDNNAMNCCQHYHA